MKPIAFPDSALSRSAMTDQAAPAGILGRTLSFLRGLMGGSSDGRTGGEDAARLRTPKTDTELAVSTDVDEGG